MNIRYRSKWLLAIAAAGSISLAGCTVFQSASEAPPSTPVSVTSLPVNEPVAGPELVVYTVVRGDTMVKIARAHDVSLADLLALNDVPNPALIEPGLQLTLPPDTAAVEAAEVAAAAAEAAAAATGATSTAETPPPAADQTWYQPWVDRLPPLPEGLQPAQPVLLAVVAVVAAMAGVGLIVLSLQLLYALFGAGASGLAFGGRRLQAVAAGIPRTSGETEKEEDDGTRRSIARGFGWRPRLSISRLSLPSARPRFGRSSPSVGTLEAPSIPAAAPDETAVPTPAPNTIEASPVAVLPPPAEVVPPSPPSAPDAISDPALVPALSHVLPPTAIPLVVSPTESLAAPLLDGGPLVGPTPPPVSVASAAPMPGGPSRPGLFARFGSAIARGTRIVLAAVAAGARRVGSATAGAARSVGRHSRVALIATGLAAMRLLRASGRAAMRLLRSSGRVTARAARRVASAPTGYVTQRGEQRRRKQFREQVESSSAARMRLGLREDSESHLQKSLDESLSHGWRLEAAWCLQLLAEEADRRKDRAIAELRRVRARELIRDHAMEEDSSS